MRVTWRVEVEFQTVGDLPEAKVRRFVRDALDKHVGSFEADDETVEALSSTAFAIKHVHSATSTRFTASYDVLPPPPPPPKKPAGVVCKDGVCIKPQRKRKA